MASDRQTHAWVDAWMLVWLSFGCVVKCSNAQMLKCSNAQMLKKTRTKPKTRTETKPKTETKTKVVVVLFFQGPTVIFLDEIDALASTRNSEESSDIRQVKNELLRQLDGFQSKPTSKDGQKGSHVTFLAATNFPWALDSVRIDNTCLCLL